MKTTDVVRRIRANRDAVKAVVDTIAALRSEGGCPWDREQTLESLKPFLVEEAYELLDAVEEGDPARHMDELGDVLLQILLQARIREEEGSFSFADVARHLSEKMIRRHPHVFGEVTAKTSDDVLRNWERIKATEHGAARKSVLAGVPRRLPALHRAQRMQSKASRVGFDWSRTDEVMAKVEEELAELREAIASGDSAAVREEAGDLLFSIVNLCRFQKVHAEDALDLTVRKFRRRFEAVERQVAAMSRTMAECSLEELDGLWNAVKAREKRGKRRPGKASGKPRRGGGPRNRASAR